MLFPTTGFADVTLLDKDQPAPFEGYLFPTEKVLQFRTIWIERDKYKELSESLQSQVEIQKVIADSNLKEVVEENRKSELQKILWFGIGVVVTGGAFYAIKAITK